MIIKRIQQSSNAYHPQLEVVCSRVMDVAIVKRMGFKFTSELGLYKEVGTSTSADPKPQPQPLPTTIKKIMEKMDDQHTALVQRFDLLSAQVATVTQRHSNLLVEIVTLVASCLSLLARPLLRLLVRRHGPVPLCRPSLPSQLIIPILKSFLSYLAFNLVLCLCDPSERAPLFGTPLIINEVSYLCAYLSLICYYLSFLMMLKRGDR